MSGYIGINNRSKKISKLYIGINNLSKKVNKCYIGVNGVSKLWYTSEPESKYITVTGYSGLNARYPTVYINGRLWSSSGSQLGPRKLIDGDTIKTWGPHESSEDGDCRVTVNGITYSPSLSGQTIDIVNKDIILGIGSPKKNVGILYINFSYS